MEKKKKGFVMPHLMLMILGLLIIMSLLTYVIPAGQFAKDPETGKIIGTQFSYLGSQTPVSPWRAMLSIKDGIVNSGTVIATLLAAGGLTGVILATKRMDNVIDYAIFRLKDKGIDVLVPILSLVFAVYGTFAGGDFIIAMVPIGVMIAKKLRLDPIVGFAIIIVTIMLGATSSPTAVMLPQLMMNVPIYSGFGTRMLLQLPVYAMVVIYIWRYAKKIAKDPTKSLMGNTDWLEGEVDLTSIKEVTLEAKDVICTILYFMVPVATVICTSKLGYGQEVIPAINILFAFAIGVVHGFDLNSLCNKFAGGVGGMAFVGFIIGCANAMSIVMNEGNILHTIVYVLCLPLQSFGPGIAAVGISVVVTLINLLIPSASAKVAILCPIITPMCEALSVPLQIGVSAFKYGDAVTNVCSPVHGVVLGGLETAHVSFDKYFKWVMPLVAMILVYCYITLYVMGMAGWTGV